MPSGHKNVARLNIEKLTILEDEDLLKQISYFSYQELLELDKNANFNNIRVQNDNKILNISLN